MFKELGSVLGSIGGGYLGNKCSRYIGGSFIDTKVDTEQIKLFGKIPVATRESLVHFERGSKTVDRICTGAGAVAGGSIGYKTGTYVDQKGIEYLEAREARKAERAAEKAALKKMRKNGGDI